MNASEELRRVGREVRQRWAVVRASSPGAHVGVPWVAVSTVAAVIATALVSRPLIGALSATTTARWGWSANIAADGHLDRIITAIPMSRDPFMMTSMCVSLMVAVGGLERLAGHLRAFLTFLGGAVFGYLAITTAVFLLRRIGVSEPAWANTLDYGASAGIAASSAAIAALLNIRIVTIGTVLFILGGLALHHQIADWEHLLAFTASFLITRRSPLVGGPSTETA